MGFVSSCPSEREHIVFLKHRYVTVYKLLVVCVYIATFSNCEIPINCKTKEGLEESLGLSYTLLGYIFISRPLTSVKEFEKPQVVRLHYTLK